MSREEHWSEVNLEDVATWVRAHHPGATATGGRTPDGRELWLVSAPDETHGCGWDTFGSGATEKGAWVDAWEACL